jgi:hypothetical protein
MVVNAQLFRRYEHPDSETQHKLRGARAVHTFSESRPTTRMLHQALRFQRQGETRGWTRLMRTPERSKARLTKYNRQGLFSALITQENF